MIRYIVSDMPDANMRLVVAAGQLIDQNGETQDVYGQREFSAEELLFGQPAGEIEPGVYDEDGNSLDAADNADDLNDYDDL